MAQDPPALLILTHGASWEARFQVSSLAASTAATGSAVAIGLFFDALALWAEDRWDVLDPSSARLGGRRELVDYPALSSLLLPGRGQGRVRLYACSTSVRLLGLEPGALQQRVDAIVGWPTFARLVSLAQRVVTFA